MNSPFGKSRVNAKLKISLNIFGRQKLEPSGYIVVADSIDLSSFKFSQWAPKFWKTAHNDLSRSSKVIDFVTNRKLVYDFLFDFNSNLSPILPRFRDIRAFVRWKPLSSAPLIFGRKFQGVPLGVDPWHFGLANAEHAKLTEGEIIFEDFQPTWSQFTNITDGRTDDMRSASRGKNQLLIVNS